MTGVNANPVARSTCPRLTQIPQAVYTSPPSWSPSRLGCAKREAIMLKRIWQRLIWGSFSLCEQCGLHLLPVHYYSPIPDTRRLRANKHLFDVAHPMYGVEMDAQRQMQFVAQTIKPYESEFAQAGGDDFGLDSTRMPSFAPANALALYAIIRSLKPKRMIEVGSGMSTRISAAAFSRNAQEGAPGELTAIEPYPNHDLRRGFPGLARLDIRPVEQVAAETFLELGENDILFIDSSHTVKAFGDVNYLFLSVIPRLRPGVLIHVHDIFFPRDYLPHHFFNRGVKQIWQEQYLLHAFLMFNREFETLLCSSYLHFRHLDELRKTFAWYHETRCPSSFWMRRVVPRSAGA
jgi:predicted O-methyltransferase YrrM